MQTKTFDFTISKAYGNDLPKPIEVTGCEYNTYESVDEVKKAEKWPSEDEILKFVNQREKANARSGRTSLELEKAGLKPVPDSLKDTEGQISHMVRALVASGKYNQEQATQIAKNALGVG